MVRLLGHAHETVGALFGFAARQHLHLAAEVAHHHQTLAKARFQGRAIRGRPLHHQGSELALLHLARRLSRVFHRGRGDQWCGGAARRATREKEQEERALHGATPASSSARS